MAYEIASISIILVGFALLFVSYIFRVKGKNGYFELFFLFSGIVNLAGLFVMYSMLEKASLVFANTLLAVFSAVMWGYFIVLFYFFIRLIILLFEMVKTSVGGIGGKKKN
jgi:hypothetical protein